MLKTMMKRILPKPWRRRARALQWRIEEIWGLRRGLRALWLYRGFRKDLRRYRALPGAETIDSLDFWPCLFDNTETTPFNAEYFYQDSWATRRILQTRPKQHLDIGSDVHFIGVLSAAVPVHFIDLRPLEASLSNLEASAGSVLELPFPNDSIASLSCLHVIEHIGLGRYGDPLDPEGTRKAAQELTRVLAPGGNLFVGMPVGRERVCFNAHRVHLPQTILHYFRELELLEFSCIVGEKTFHEKADPLNLDLGKSACGMFWFTKNRADEHTRQEDVERDNRQ